MRTRGLGGAVRPSLPLGRACLFLRRGRRGGAIRGGKARPAHASHCDRRTLGLLTTLGGVAATCGNVNAEGIQSDTMPTVPQFQVRPDLSLSRIVKGCWQLSGGHRGDRLSDRTSGKSAVEDFQAFVDAGITTFDTADIYDPSEELIGRYVKSRGGAEGLQIFTKFCCFGRAMYTDATEGIVAKRIDASRSRLNVDKLDLVQLYWDDYRVKNYVQAALLLASNPNVRHFGVTNFDAQTIEEMVAAGATPAINQVQYSLLDRRPENGTVALCAKCGIKLMPYGVLAGGLLSDKYLGMPQSEVEVDTYSKSKYLSVIRQSGGWSWFQDLLRAAKEVADRHGASISNVACRWVLDRPEVAGVLVGARNASHVRDHTKVFKLELNPADLATIQAVLDSGTQAKGDCYAWERGGTF